MRNDAVVRSAAVTASVAVPGQASQQRVRGSHLNSGTLHTLLADCLRFQKDDQMNPGSIGVFRTRAILCELLAMRMLRELSTREVT
jgi:hypothetical protein